MAASEVPCVCGGASAQPANRAHHAVSGAGNPPDGCRQCTCKLGTAWDTRRRMWAADRVTGTAQTRDFLRGEHFVINGRHSAGCRTLAFLCAFRVFRLSGGPRLPVLERGKRRKVCKRSARARNDFNDRNVAKETGKSGCMNCTCREDCPLTTALLPSYQRIRQAAPTWVRYHNWDQVEKFRGKKNNK
jgi:hypothetical protein